MSNVSRREAGPVLLGADIDNRDTETQDIRETDLDKEETPLWDNKT